jgi:uncharacterized protein YbjT (DUF2867 family)
VARVLIVAGGCRGRRLAAELVRAGHPARITTRTEEGRAAIESCGAECWIGEPDRLATLRGALDQVTVVCWLLGSATGPPAHVCALHTSRLESFLTQAIDTSVRGFVYEAAGMAVSAQTLAAGERIVRAVAERNALPTALLRASGDSDAWLGEARSAVNALIGEESPRSA